VEVAYKGKDTKLKKASRGRRQEEGGLVGDIGKIPQRKKKTTKYKKESEPRKPIKDLREAV